MIAGVTKNMNQEILALENSSDPQLLEHFGNKMLKIGWEASKFEIDEAMIDFEQLKPKFDKMNLGLSRYQRILDKLAAKDFDNFFDAKSRVISSTKIQCDFEGCQEMIEGGNIQNLFLDHYFQHVSEKYKTYGCEECEAKYRKKEQLERHQEEKHPEESDKIESEDESMAKDDQPQKQENSQLKG